MNRPWLIWSSLLACAALILGMMGWMTHRSLTAEKERADARVEADYFERIRLAVSRMETIGANLLVVENQRPPLHYQSVFSPGDIYTRDLQNLDIATVLQPSPLLLAQEEYTRLHFEFGPNQELRSPQVPKGANRDLSLNGGLTVSDLDLYQKELNQLAKVFPKERRSEFTIPIPKDDEKLAVSKKKLPQNQGSWSAQEQKSYGDVLNRRERETRLKTLAKANEVALENAVFNNLKQEAQAAPKSIIQFDRELLNESAALNEAPLAKKSPPQDSLISLTPFESRWINGELLLLREVRGSRSIKYQGVWLDQKKLMTDFAGELTSDLENVSLKPALVSSGDPFELVSLPWQLVLGLLPTAELPLWTPMRKTLAAGWVGALIALAALAALLRGVLQLSERRAAFVSSVTHELRTPLTTFRLYSEMLADGMVPDEATKQDYLRTMQGESERLNHLVENVLSYSQVERGTARSKFEKLAVADLVERLRPILQRRVDQEEATLSIEIDPAAGELETDVTAVEQIIFNLIDNACKYGLPEDRMGRVFLRARREKNGLIFEVRDEGKGVNPRERKRLFRAFHKSAREAAHSKPGVGLGLALSRRLAKALGGSLTIGSSPNQGASFLLQLP